MTNALEVVHIPR